MDRCPEYVHCGCFLHAIFLHLYTEQIWNLNERYTSVRTEGTSRSMCLESLAFTWTAFRNAPIQT